MTEKKLTHVDAEGRVRMVDVGEKPATLRTARAEGRVRMKPETLALALAGDAKKGDVRAAAEIAGVMAAKRTSDLIPLCHPLQLSGVDVSITPDETAPGFVVRATVRTTAPTGVEMEALTAVSVACLTLYDMLKAADRLMSIDAIRVTEKSGGASGDFKRDEAC
jgi:cyclic pyranopterin phosphate synthase